MVAKGVTALCLLRPYLPLTRLLGVSAYVMPTAPVGLRRMRELRNCHFSGNFVTEAAHHLGAAETVRSRVLYCCENSGGERKHAVSRRRTRGLSLKITTFSFISLKEKV